MTGLTLALSFASLKQTFYTNGLAAGATLGLTATQTSAVTTILSQETAHVSLLSGIVSPPATPAYDFTGGSGSGTGPFAPFTDGVDFLALAQLLEDASVRALKGQLPSLIGDPNLPTAFQLHSIEARHSAHIRSVRGQSPYMPAVSDVNDYGASFTPDQLSIAIAVYGPHVATRTPTGQITESDGEDNVIQHSSYRTDGVISNIAAAFDAPLSTDNAAAVLSFFNVT